jgi:hypothetical protein
MGKHTSMRDEERSGEQGEGLSNPEQGHPAGETVPDESSPGQLEDTPTITDEEQDKGQTQHAASE